MRILASVGLALVLAGCSSSQFNRNVSAPDYPPWKGDVAVLTELPPAGTFERLGVVVVTTGDAGTATGMVRDIKKAAAKQGANAVMLQHDEPTALRTGDVGTAHKMGAWAFRLQP